MASESHTKEKAWGTVIFKYGYDSWDWDSESRRCSSEADLLLRFTLCM